MTTPLPHVVALHHERPDLRPSSNGLRWLRVPGIIRNRTIYPVAGIVDAYAYMRLSLSLLPDDYWAVSGDLLTLHRVTGNSVGAHCRACDPTAQGDHA